MVWVNRGAEFAELLRGIERSAWRWECQATYREPDEREPLRAWRDGRPDFAFMGPWLNEIREQRAAGKTFERVRMLTDPPTEYLRWLISFTHLNVEAGEDIRWITESRARELRAPVNDFYLLDDERVAILHFDDNGVAGADLTDDADAVALFRTWRETVWPVAMPHADQFQPSTRSP